MPFGYHCAKSSPRCKICLKSFHTPNRANYAKWYHLARFSAVVTGLLHDSLSGSFSGIVQSGYHLLSTSSSLSSWGTTVIHVLLLNRFSTGSAVGWFSRTSVSSYLDLLSLRRFHKTYPFLSHLFWMILWNRSYRIPLFVGVYIKVIKYTSLSGIAISYIFPPDSIQFRLCLLWTSPQVRHVLVVFIKFYSMTGCSKMSVIIE